MGQEASALVPRCPKCGEVPVTAGPKGTHGRTPQELTMLTADERDQLDPSTPEYACQNGHSWVPE